MLTNNIPTVQDAKHSFQPHGLVSRMREGEGTAGHVRLTGPTKQAELGLNKQVSELVLVVAGHLEACGGQLSPSLYHLRDIYQQHGSERSRLFLEDSYHSEFWLKQLKIDYSFEHRLNQTD